MAKSESELLTISPDIIEPNQDNPRLVFREDELRDLYNSISEVGIRVPISVYRNKGKYVLLDGERRWRCACKLNLKKMPALVQPKPEPLENLIMMFNIHNVRVQWDPLPTAMKLLEIKNLLEKEGMPAKVQEIAGITGLSVARVKRLFDLLELPAKYRRLLMSEAKKPKNQQRFNVDVFVEINKAAKAVEKNTPEVFETVKKGKFIDEMFVKYKDKVENSVVSFRDISKIARGVKTGVPKKAIVPVIIKLVNNRSYRIEKAYRDSVKSAYELSDIESKSVALTGVLRECRKGQLPENLKKQLRNLRVQINRLVGYNK